MPLFRWSFSKEGNYRAKLEHKMCVAKESPEPVFDLADCNLAEVPPGVFSMCRVFRKESLLLQENHLSSLRGGGSLKDLSNLKLLDLHSNRFSSFFEDIGYLGHIQILNLEKNRLKKLPNSFSKLTRLQNLNLKENSFREFPSVLCQLPHLRILNISGNEKLCKLPKNLCEVVALETLVLDPEKFTYPSSDVCSNGTEAIMQFLCSESGKEYVSPSQYLDRRDSEEKTQEIDNSLALLTDVNLPASYSVYQKKKDRRKQELIQLEEALRDNSESHAQFAADALVRRQRLLENVAEEQGRLEDEILQIQNKKEKERHHLIAILSNVEDHSAKLIEQIISLNEKMKNTDGILELMEQDRRDSEELFTIKQEELDNLRKKDVLAAMQEIFQAEELQRQHEAGRLDILRKFQESSNDTDQKLSDILSGHEQDQQALIRTLLEEEAYQKEAFEMFQLQRDQRHNEINYQIKLIEKELSKLTMAELKKKDLKMNFEQNVMAERRTALACLLTELLEEKDKREEELKKRVCEMEQRRQEETQDYWLIQYQKLMDRKPQELIDLELSMDSMVRAVLLEAGAGDYLALFATKLVTWPQLLVMTMKDLKKLGILNTEICIAILEKTREYCAAMEKEKNLYLDKEKISNFKEVPTPEELPSPSAPEEEEDEMPIEVTASAPVLSPEIEVKLWCQTECVVCLDKESSAVFLPCGHICCCWECSKPLNACPMCRNEISARFVIALS